MKSHFDLILFILLLVAFGLFAGCANVSTTKIHFAQTGTDGKEGEAIDMEMPKELTATNFSVTFDVKAGTATIKADSIKTTNLEAIKAQSQAAKDTAAAVTAAGVKAAMSSIAPAP